MEKLTKKSTRISTSKVYILLTKSTSRSKIDKDKLIQSNLPFKLVS